MKRGLVFAVSSILLVGACAPGDVQTTSGQSYLEGYGTASRDDGKNGGEEASRRATADKAIRKAANVEPILRFPARFGLARIVNTRLSAIPPEEAEIWQAAVTATDGRYGEFVPISPLVAAFTTATTTKSRSESRHYPEATLGEVVESIRLGAARQHVDAVLVYEVVGRSDDRASMMSALDLTIIGAYILPTRTVSGSAVAQAVLIDVRNGYPYLTVSGAASSETMHASVGSSDARWEQKDIAAVAAVKEMVDKLPALFDQLRGRLGERSARR